MIEGWANDIVILLAGVVVGSLLSAATQLDPRPSVAAIPRNPGESFVAWQIRIQKTREAPLDDAPRSFTLMSFALFGFVVVLVVSIVVSPLVMRWWWFAGGGVVGYAAEFFVPKLVQAGKLPGPPEESLVSAVRGVLGRRKPEDPGGIGTPSG